MKLDALLADHARRVHDGVGAGGPNHAAVFDLHLVAVVVAAPLAHSGCQHALASALVHRIGDLVEQRDLGARANAAVHAAWDWRWAEDETDPVLDHLRLHVLIETRDRSRTHRG